MFADLQFSLRLMRIRSVLATVHKEWLLLRRDWGGLLMLLVMPAALIVIMALVQDAPFRDYQELRFDLLLADEDGGPLSAELRSGLAGSKSFHIVDRSGGAALNRSTLLARVESGEAHMGIVIPKGASAEVANSANTIANSLADQLGNGRLPQRAARDSVYIHLYFDPVAKPAFRMAIRSALEKLITGASSKMLVARISKLAGGSDTGADLGAVTAGLGVRESALEAGNQPAPGINSVQHNVPAWAIFGMFFIVVPLSGHIIRERELGSSLRVRLIPGADGPVALGRIVFNTIICCAQFLVMCAVGKLLLPVFGLPPLGLGAHPGYLTIVVCATAICATSYGYLIGTLFRSAAQALPFAAISIVILSALGGIWVPVELLPAPLRAAANVSPLHWALEGVQNVILRNQGWSGVLLPSAILCGLALAMLGAGLLVKRIRPGDS
jgi:ABC-2 type transport system permease protein